MNDDFLPSPPIFTPMDDDQFTDLMDDVKSTAASTDAAPPCAAITAACNGTPRLSPNQWTGVVRNIVRCLTADELKSLRLVGSKELRVDLADPSLTCHLPLRMDRASFFAAENAGDMPNDRLRKWLTDRRILVIDDVDARICPDRVARLAAEGYLDSVSVLVVFDCHVHRAIISVLAHLPNLESLRLADHEDCEEKGLEELESIATHVARINPSSFRHLDIEFDCTVHGSRLSFLERMYGLEHLRLRGFDLSDGINYMKGLGSLTSLHLCHGNFYSSPSNDVDEKDLSSLTGMTNLRRVHLEGFDALSSVGLAPFCAPSPVERLVLKHCQELSEECLPSLGRMVNLTSLHVVHSAYDDAEIFSTESLGHLNSLALLKSLSLFYVLEDLSNLIVLWGLDSLESLNVAVEQEVDAEVLELFCSSILPVFPSLRKLRIFSEDGMCYTCHHRKLEVEYSTFNFGDLVYLD